MNFLSALFTYFATKQDWADSDRVGGTLHFLIPTAENLINHVAVTPPSALGQPTNIAINQHISFAELFAATAIPVIAAELQPTDAAVSEATISDAPISEGA